MEELEADEKEIENAVAGMSISDAIVFRTFKAMGLSEKTMVMIEKDLRIQQKQALESVNIDVKKDDNSTK